MSVDSSHPFRLSLAAALALAFVVLPGRGWAQSSSSGQAAVNEVVIVTASVMPVEAKNTGRAVSVLTGEDLAALGVRSIIEGLRLVPGVDARARGPRDVQTDFSIRGATFGQNLVLVDGARLNDSQSGHHNGEIPLPAIAVDRVEVVAGAGSAVHGADALGGTINVISRRGEFAEVSVAAGEHGYADAQGTTSGRGLPIGWLASGWASRSSGFAFDRDFALGGAALRGSPRRDLTVEVRHQRRAFGANGFYGASPSKEWTDQSMAGISLRRPSGVWTTVTRANVRNHGDHFRWDIARPGFAENRHRTNAFDAAVDASRMFGDATLALGASGSGDWVRSSNLGDHDYSRGSAYGELQSAIGARASVSGGLRFDHYSTFGSSLSPSLSAVTRLGRDVRARASLARAFRVPTFTELFYSDPGNLGSPDLEAEHSWSLDGGLDWGRNEWRASFTVFRRWDDNVIDWVRETAADRWRSTNVRDVRARGFEASIGRRWAGAFVRVHYAGLRLDAPVLSLLSKYVLEYARHQSGGSITVPVGAGFRVAMNVDHRHRRDGQSYDLVSARVSRQIGRAELSIDGTNLLDEVYHEVVGVEMPGRWMTVGVTVR